MESKREMQRMSKEQLREISLRKNKKRVATLEAVYAQELLWEERYPELVRLEDVYEGWIDENDENVQNLLDEIHIRRYFGWRG